MTTPISREIAEQRVTPGSARQTANVGDLERLLSLVAGETLAFFGMRRGGLAGLGLAALGGGMLYRGISGNCAAYRALGVNTTNQRNPVASVAASRGFKVVASVAVNRPAEQLFELWRDFEGLPRFMHHLISVKADGMRSHWVARGPADSRVEWDAEVINSEPGRLIAWRSLEGSQISTAGSVHFTPLPADHGTEVRIVLKYDPPAGKLGGWVAWLFGADPRQQVRNDLRRFKHLAECGEIPSTRGQSSCRGRD